MNKSFSIFSESRVVGSRASARLCAGLVLCAIFSACGGGGGGGSSSGGGSSDSSSGVRVLHAAVDGAPVDVLSSARSGALASKIFFADKKGYRSLPSGEQTISLTRALDVNAVVASFAIASSGDDRYSVLLYGSLSSGGLKAKLLEDLTPSEFSGSLVRFVNGVNGASTVLVNVSGGEGAQQVSLGGVSDYISTAPGEVRITANRAAGGGALVSMTETLDEGGAYTVLVAGEVGYYSKGVLFRDR